VGDIDGSARRLAPHDAELVCRARTGDRDAFAELVLRHAPTARRLAARMLGDDELARDVVQEAAVLALVSLDRLANPDRFGSWLAGIALNVARRWLRERRSFDEIAVEPADPGPGPDEFAAERDIAVRVRRAVADLAPGQRDAVLLFYLQGLAHREVAAELGISIGAVKARLHQARAALGRQLAAEMPMDKGKSMTEWVPVSVAEVRATEEEWERRPHVMILREHDGERQLAIWIGPAEATALATTLDNVEMPRPATYQFAKSLVQAAGATVSEVRVTTLSERTPPGHGLYYAVAIVNGHEVDCRPSDAVNLALVAGAPVLVSPEIFATSDEDLLSKYPLSTEDIAALVRVRFP
jgi:RNA polymerase sigma factor (sigma-70 family)